MGIAASDLNRHVIRPTLLYLGSQCVAAEALLLGIAACQSSLGAELDSHNGYGLYRISAFHHQRLWDDHLAASPELASRVRGLASQHAFLGAPHFETDRQPALCHRDRLAADRTPLQRAARRR